MSNVRPGPEIFHNYSRWGFINVGTGSDLSIEALARLVADTVGFAPRILTDPSQPDDTFQKLMDIARLQQMGWHARIGLAEGLEQTYRWYVENEASSR